MLKKIFSIFIIVVSLLNSLTAQENNGNLVTFTEKDGIPSNFINCILQDHLGYIWIGTENGLLKYDGYKFQRYDMDQIVGRGYFNPVISSLYEDSELNLWIGTAGGVVKYNRIKEKSQFYNFYSVYEFSPGILLLVSKIVEDISGTIWFGINNFYDSQIKDGIAFFEKGKDDIKIYKTEQDSIESQRINDIEIDDKNNLWISGSKGLSRINVESMLLERIKFKNSPIESFNSALHVDNNGILWGGQSDVGFGSYDPSTGHVKSYSFNFADSNSLSNNNVNSIIQDKDGTIWLSTNNGINHFDPETEKFERYFYHKGFEINRKEIGPIGSILLDKSGSLWIGSFDKFVHKFDPSKKLFRLYKHKPNNINSINPAWIFGLLEDSDGNIWTGGITDDFASGLSKYNSITNTFVRIEDKKRINPVILTLYHDSRGTMWVGSGSSGLLTFNSVTSSFTKVSDEFPGTDNIPPINDILEDHLLNFWIGTDNGLFLFDRSNKKMERIHFKDSSNTDFEVYHIQHIFESRKKELWFGTTNGLFKYNHSNKTFNRYAYDPNDSNSLNNNNIGTIYEDYEGIIWLGTWFGGLNRFDPESETFTNYSVEDGLPSNSIQGILEDENNNALWLSTFEGISRFDLTSKEFRNFNASHGLQGKQFARTSALETKNGDFIFGGANGLNIFRPEDIFTNQTAPDVIISDFKLFNKSVSVDNDSPLQKPIYQTEKIVLASDENDISINYLATHYVDPSHNQYAYMLENYENKWRYVGNTNSAIYPNLPPGEYIFRVKASNNTGVWNNKGKSLTIIILAPWWQTWWAYSLFVLSFFGVLYLTRRFELNRRREKENKRILEAENKRKTEELEEARQLQLSMLPKQLPQLSNLDIAVYMQTATEVGGDYYDFSIKEDGSLNIALGDATGHGMKAGIMVSSMKSIFTTNAPKMDIEEFFITANKGIKSMKLQRMMMGFAMLNIKNNEFKLINAGMPPVFLFRKKSAIVEEFTEHSMPIGAMSLSKYNVKYEVLGKGDVILLMSDGMPELQNDKNEIYGYERSKSEFKSVAIKSPQEIVDHFKNSVSQWLNSKDPHDDVTFVVIKMNE